MKIITMIIFLMLVGCSDYEEVIQITDNHCTAESKAERAGFILQCVQGANPKSDEEPEDWLRVCQGMAEDTYCEMRTYDVFRFCRWDNICRETGRKVKPND